MWSFEHRTPPPAHQSGSRRAPPQPTRRPPAPLLSVRFRSVVPHTPKRRIKPRTVDAGTPNRPAIRRCPSPAPRATNAAPITPTLSRRRNSTTSGNNTCVERQPTQRARRGRTRASPAAVRTFRTRAWPHPARRSPHPGHARPPAISSCSTHSRSPLTMSTDASGITQEGPPRATAKESEGVLARTNRAHADAPASPPPTRDPAHASSPRTTPNDPRVLNYRGALHSRRAPTSAAPTCAARASTPRTFRSGESSATRARWPG